MIPRTLFPCQSEQLFVYLLYDGFNKPSTPFISPVTFMGQDSGYTPQQKKQIFSWNFSKFSKKVLTSL